METILFRGIRKDNHEFIYGYYCRFGYTDKEKDYIIPYYASACTPIEILHKPDMFTGCLDHNKKEIYENDSVECVSWNEFFSHDGKTMEPFRRKMIVEFHNCAFKLREDFPEETGIQPTYWDMIVDGDLTILGNTHEGLNED